MPNIKRHYQKISDDNKYCSYYANTQNGIFIVNIQFFFLKSAAKSPSVFVLAGKENINPLELTHLSGNNELVPINSKSDLF